MRSLSFCLLGLLSLTTRVTSQGYGAASEGGSNPFKTRADFEAEMGPPRMNPVLPPSEDKYFPPPEIPHPEQVQVKETSV